MKIVGMMLARNEDWILGASARVALKWCDALAVCLHNTLDRSPEILNDVISETPKSVEVIAQNSEEWDEMDIRDWLLASARRLGGTHYAIIDADEILTANFLPYVREQFAALAPKQALDVPMIAMRTLRDYQNDGTVWSHSKITLGFCDDPSLTHKPQGDGYQHHNRPPHGITEHKVYNPQEVSGVMHLQFANQRRLKAKHVLYRMIDRQRWPDRHTVAELNAKYDAALQAPGATSPIPAQCWGDYPMAQIRLEGKPWQEEEIVRMVEQHGEGTFEGLDFKGLCKKRVIVH